MLGSLFLVPCGQNYIGTLNSFVGREQRQAPKKLIK